MDSTVSQYIALGRNNSVENTLWSYFYADNRTQWDALLNNRDDCQTMEFLKDWLKKNIDGYKSAGIDRAYYIDWIEFETEEYLNWFVLKFS